jgi:hypothetical protein
MDRRFRTSQNPSLRTPDRAITARPGSGTIIRQLEGFLIARIVREFGLPLQIVKRGSRRLTAWLVAAANDLAV